MLTACLSSSLFSQTCADPNAIISVRKYRIGQFEYVKFTIRTPFTATYTVTNVGPPDYGIAEGASPGTTVAGCKFKNIQFKLMNWFCHAPIINANPTTTIKAIKLAEQFEGYISYTIGYRCPSTRYVNTTTIGNPAAPAGGIYKVIMKFKR